MGKQHPHKSCGKVVHSHPIAIGAKRAKSQLIPCWTVYPLDKWGADATFPVFSYPWGRGPENDPAVPRVTGKREKISQGRSVPPLIIGDSPWKD